MRVGPSVISYWVTCAILAWMKGYLGFYMCLFSFLLELG